MGRSKAPPMTVVEERALFLTKIRKYQDHWLWTGARNHANYGTGAKAHGETMPAHRASWELFRGPIPSGLVIDHLCRKHRCVNPDHLEPVTTRENVLRSPRWEALRVKREEKRERQALQRARRRQVNAERRRERKAARTLRRAEQPPKKSREQLQAEWRAAHPGYVPMGERLKAWEDAISAVAVRHPKVAAEIRRMVEARIEDVRQRRMAEEQGMSESA
jgi:hypothetical protein